MATYTLKVSDIYIETHDSKTICFKQPALKKVKYKSGQYLTLIININGRKYRRPYSFSSSFDIDTSLNITVKRVPGGIVSNHLIDMIKIGDLIEVIEPMGDFTFENNIHQDKELFLWGAGSGITPLMSILKTVLNFNSQKINLLYCNKNLEQTIFYKQLLDLSEQYKDRFSLFLYFTEDNVINAKHGRITDSNIGTILENLSDITKTIHYICGPAGLKENVKTKLIETGLSDDAIFSEDFEHIVNENELKEIQTRFVGFMRKGIKINVEVVRGKSILEAGLDSQIDLPYSCQTGSCKLCKAKLIRGQVKKISNTVPEFELMENERLLCCSYPLTDNIIFEIY